MSAGPVVSGTIARTREVACERDLTDRRRSSGGTAAMGWGRGWTVSPSGRGWTVSPSGREEGLCPQFHGRWGGIGRSGSRTVSPSAGAELCPLPGLVVAERGLGVLPAGAVYDPARREP